LWTKRIPVWGWVFDFFVIPICSEYLEKKTESKNHWFWVFENFPNQKNHWVRVFDKKIKITEGPVLGISKASKNCWVS
jgi:hypothetical protein